MITYSHQIQYIVQLLHSLPPHHHSHPRRIPRGRRTGAVALDLLWGVPPDLDWRADSLCTAGGSQSGGVGADPQSIAAARTAVAGRLYCVAALAGAASGPA